VRSVLRPDGLARGARAQLREPLDLRDHFRRGYALWVSVARKFAGRAPAVGRDFLDPDLDAFGWDPITIHERIGDVLHELALERDVARPLQHADNWHDSLPFADRLTVPFHLTKTPRPRRSSYVLRSRNVIVRH
jgi:hypothetical protein